MAATGFFLRPSEADQEDGEGRDDDARGGDGLPVHDFRIRKVCQFGKQ